MSFDDELERLCRIKPNLERRSRIVQLIRTFFFDPGFLEVETPVRVPSVAPEQFIIPLTSEDWFLSTSPELYMKRLLACGYDKLFQLSRSFRKGEAGHLHNPEFTLLEWYRKGAGYSETIEDTEQLVALIADSLGLGSSVRYLDTHVDLTLPWPRVTVSNAFKRAAGWDPVARPDPDRFDLDLSFKVVPSFPAARPMVLTGYPAPQASLARLDPRDPRVAERAEVFIAGLDLANAYTELNDPAEQRRRFEEEAEIIRQAGGKATVSKKFLQAVGHMPPCGGIALGVDRLVMLFCNATSIQDVLAFPQDWA